MRENNANKIFLRETIIVLCSSVLVNAYLSHVSFSKLNGIGREYQNRLVGDMLVSTAILLLFVANYWRIAYDYFRDLRSHKRQFIQQLSMLVLIVGMLVLSSLRVSNFIDLKHVWWQVYAQGLLGLLLIGLQVLFVRGGRD